MNFCTACKADFSSVRAFDRHRVGRHAYLYADGLEMIPQRLDGRRCLDPDEMRLLGIASDHRGRWTMTDQAGSTLLAEAA